MKFATTCNAIAGLFLNGCAAHMMLDWPTPYGRDTLNNSPLEPSGSDFPCKLRAGVYALTEMNHWLAGEAQAVRFLGTAVHGGGSCQFSVTTDVQPTKASSWKVVDSRVGGCPASAPGNLEEGPSAQKADTFDVVLPKEMPNGIYTFAWTWFNRVGNREMYMNCAPVTVSGGTDNSTFLDSLPDMFVANLPAAECATTANYDLAFPEPGEAVTTAKQAQVVSTVEGIGCPSMTKLGAGEGTMHLPQMTTESSGRMSGGKPTTLRTSKEASKTVSYSTMEGARSTSVSIMFQQYESSVVTGVYSANQGTSASASPDPGRFDVKGSPSGDCVACQTAGAVLCIDDRDFGLCDGTCALRQPLAPGTFCSQGLILKRGLPAPN